MGGVRQGREEAEEEQEVTQASMTDCNLLIKES
jgi:hypothetical protein